MFIVNENKSNGFQVITNESNEFRNTVLSMWLYVKLLMLIHPPTQPSIQPPPNLLYPLPLILWGKNVVFWFGRSMHLIWGIILLSFLSIKFIYWLFVVAFL